MSRPTAIQQLKFPGNVIQQGKTKVYTFVVTADELVEIARVERFGESSDGVNRKLNEDHAFNIATAMLKPDTVMLDAICGDLKGEWEVRNGFLVPGEGAYLSIDDGQHRFHACTMLNPEERKKWSFNVTATRGLDYTTRLRIFRQQMMRRRIDSKLDLAQRHRLGEWRNEVEEHAYELVLLLNSSPTSPLQGMIVLDETVKRSYEHQHRVEGINANGLWASLRSVIGTKSPLYTVSMEKRTEVAVNMIRLASEVWANAWCSSGHVLTTARGINAVLKLIVSGSNFRIVVGEDFTIESLRNALELAGKFNWTTKAHKNAGQDEMVAALDAAIGRGYQRKLESGVASIKA